MSSIHLTMMGKGGVGKTLVASLLAQYMSKNESTKNSPLCLIDTDPVNASFTQYKAWQVEPLRLQEEGSTRINERRFDALMERLLTEEANFVIDTGAATFVPLSNYLIENQAVNMLLAAGKHVVVHAVITGGQGQTDTINGLHQLADQFPSNIDLVVWLNPFFGSIEHEGKTFREMAVFKKHKDRITAIIEIPAHTSDTFGADVTEMLEKKLTFDEAVQSDRFSIMSRQRLTIVRNAIFERIGAALAA